MADVLLIGSGPLPGPAVRHMGFPQLRLASMKAAIEQAGHRLDTVCLGVDIDPTAADWLEMLAERSAGAAVLVSAGPYLPGMAACLIAGERPVWADLPGDPFAELQAATMAGVVDTARHAAARAAALALLSRADGISVISDRQRHACLGQLGVLDRLSAPPTVAVQPVAYDLPLPRLAPRPRTASVTVALSGGFNTWFDDRATVALLERALAEHPGLTVVCTGGSIAGHYTDGAARFAQWAARHPERVQQHGWVPHEQLVGILGQADVGLILDVPSAEPILGSRTRALLFSWLGIAIAATPGCQLLADMAAEDLILPLTGRSDDVGRLLSADPARTRRADAWLEARFGQARTLAPLLRWLEAPARAPSAPAQEALVAANARLKAQLQAVHQSPTWRLLSPLHRVLQQLTAARR